MTATLGRRVTAEAIGTGFLVAVVVGSGIFAQRLSPDDVGLQLLENSTATAGGPRRPDPRLRVGVRRPLQPGRLARRPRLRRAHARASLLAYIPAQIVGACVGAIVANLMFDLDAVNLSTHDRAPAVTSGSARSSPPSGC